MSPPPDDDDHGCDWKQYAKHLEARVAILEKAFERRSEKRAKAPRTPKPARTAEETRATREDLAKTRREGIVDEEPEVVRVPEDQKHCELCDGDNFRPVGDGKTSERYYWVEGHFRRRRLCREVLACRCSGTVVTAPLPDEWRDKGKYDASVVAHLIVSKIAMALPHYRLEQSFERAGVPIARSTLNNLFRKGAQRLLPLAPVLFEELKQRHIVLADETSFNLTTAKSKAFIWVFVSDDVVGYRFSTSRGSSVPVDVLRDTSGVLVCDDYRGYDPAESVCQRRRAGCFAHARRKFIECGEDPVAEEAIELIHAIYSVEHEAERRDIVGTMKHLALRREFARPLWVALRKLARVMRRRHGPKTLLGRAFNYIWRNQGPLSAFLHDARIPIDNNGAENALRIVALGRKNYLFVHSEGAGHELAVLFSLVASCKKNGVNPQHYFTDVLARIATTPPDQLCELLPHRWRRLDAPAPVAVFDE